MTVIRANRESIDDRFSVLGFTVNAKAPFQIGIAAHPDLFRPEHSDRRTHSNFYATGLLQSSPSQRSEAVYLVPPEVVARFVGQPRLYFGLTTYRDGRRDMPSSVHIPDRGNMYVSLTGLTERAFRRAAHRRPTGNDYDGGDSGSSFWGGDVLLSSPSGHRNGKNDMNGRANGIAGAGDGDTVDPEPAPYSDGYSDELWAATSEPRSDATSPSNLDANAPVDHPAQPEQPSSANVSIGLSVREQRHGATSAPARPLLISSDYRPSNPIEALRAQLRFFLDSAMWYLGVPDTRVMPHSAVCQIRAVDGSAEGGLHGSGFFIGPCLIMTAAHVVDGQSELIIVPGKNGGGTGSANEPFGRFKVSTFRKHPSYSGGPEFDIALIRVPAANAVPAGRYFDLVEELNQSRPEGVVVTGYAARWYASDLIEHFVNATINPNKQHMMGGHIRSLPTEETFSYNIQTLGGTSGSPVYWIEETTAGAQAHMVGVHVAAHDNTTNLGCRITPGKLSWIRTVARDWGQTLTFAQGVFAQSLSMQSAPPPARALEIIAPFYDPSDPDTALACQNDAFSQAREEWFVGVEDTRAFPHSAICHLRMTGPDGATYGGTGFYIGPKRILTCAHNLHGMSSVRIIPGRNGSGGMPFGQATVTSSAWRIAPGYTGDGDWDRDLAVIDNVPISAPGGHYFEFLLATPSDRLPIVVCGYSAASRAVPGLTDIIDGHKQHLHGGYVRRMPTPETIDYPILSLMGASGSPVYTLRRSDGKLKAKICAVHVSGQPAAEGLNRGCFITPAKIAWINGTATTLGVEGTAQAWAQAIPLDPGAGGQSIGLEALSPGDIIVSTARHPVSYAIRVGTVSAISHAMLYVGDGRIVEAIGSGVREVPLVDAIDDAILAVAYRDSRVDAAKASAIVAYARAQVGKPYNYTGVAGTGFRVLYPLHARVIEGLRRLTGTGDADAGSFYCSELVFAAFEAAGIPLTAAGPDRSSPDDIVALSRANLSYVGHLVARDEVLGIALSVDEPVSASGTSPAEGTVQLDAALVAQPDKDTGWVAAMTTLLRYRGLGAATVQHVEADLGSELARTHGGELIEAAERRYGFRELPQHSDEGMDYYAPRQWAHWLQQHGPLWTVIVGAPHAVVVAGIRGDLDDAKTCQIRLLNPWDTRVVFDNDPVQFTPDNAGYEDWHAFADFVADFSAVAEADFGNWRVLYLPAGVEPVSAPPSDGQGMDAGHELEALDSVQVG